MHPSDDDFEDASWDEMLLEKARDALSVDDIDAAAIALRSGIAGQLAARIAGEAESLISASLVAEATARIDLYLSPKFDSVAACAERYAKAMEARS